MTDDESTIEEQDAQAIAILGEAGADLDALRTIEHFLYLSNSESATAIADELRHRGFRTELRRGANEGWLVLARHEAILSVATLTSTRHAMAALIPEFGCGEYDGWDADVRPHKPHFRPN